MDETYQGGEHVVAAVQHMVKALIATNNVSDELKKKLSDLETHLSALQMHNSIEGREFLEAREQLRHAEEKIMSWVSSQSMLWDVGCEIADVYLQAVDEVRTLGDYFRSLSSEGNDGEHLQFVHQAYNTLQIAMARLEQETKHILVHSRQSVVHDISFRSCDENGVDVGSFVSAEGSVVSADDDSVDGSSARTSSSSNESDPSAVSLVHPDAVRILKSIVNVMFAANYDQEFCKAFVGTQKEALDEYLVCLGMERLSIEELLRMDWRSLESETKRWAKVVKVFVQVYLYGQKWLCDQLFADHGPRSSICFFDAAKPSITCLQDFGEAITLAPRRPEKVFCLLSTCEVLEDVWVDIDALFSGDLGSLIREEFYELVGNFRDLARLTFLEFGDYVESDTCREPLAGGGLHPLTSYVMNYLKLLLKYAETLSLLLINEGPAVEAVMEDSTDSQGDSSIACHLRSIVAKLECNLEKQAQLYKDVSLQHIFLMNNIHYIVKKVMDSDLRSFFCDEWIRARMSNYQHHATRYMRATWSSVIALLRDEGIRGSKSQQKEILKERLKGFYFAFEEVWRNQRCWCIRDPQLRDELRISISQKVVLAYQGFARRCKNYDLEKHIKYEADELENFLSDLFEGSARCTRGFWGR